MVLLNMYVYGKIFKKGHWLVKFMTMLCMAVPFLNTPPKGMLYKELNFIPCHKLHKTLWQGCDSLLWYWFPGFHYVVTRLLQGCN